MRILITGAGQIARGIVAALPSDNEPTLIRRSPDPLPGANTVSGTAADRDLLRRHASQADAILHCVHAGYDPERWRQSLPGMERAVMDVAAEADIPAVFPESVYAFGHAATNLHEGTAPNPCSPLGQVRADLLAARADHAARTISIVASDLVGPTATVQGSEPTAMVVRPVAAGRTAWLLGDPDAPHTVTTIPDLANAMLFAAAHARDLAPGGAAILHAPSPAPTTMRTLAQVVAARLGRTATVRRLPTWPLAMAGTCSPVARSLHQQRYLWREACLLHPGVLTTRHALQPTPLTEADLGER